MEAPPPKITCIETRPLRMLVLIAQDAQELDTLVARAVEKGWDDSLPTGFDPASGRPSAWLTKQA